MSGDDVKGAILHTYAEERAAALAVLDRAIRRETRPLLGDVYRAAHRLVTRHGAPAKHDGLAGAVLALAAHDHPEPAPPGVDPYGTERMTFEDGPT